MRASISHKRSVNHEQSVSNRHRPIWITIFVVSLFCFGPRVASAQGEGRPNIVLDIAKSVLFDPTTYAPAALSYTSERMDWNSSQPLFKAGFVEHNPLYTVSGRPDGTPISYDAGNHQIRREALAHLQESVVNNLSAQIFERTLTRKYPEHRKLFKVLSWAERISFSAYVGYLASADHFRQVQRNGDLAREYGIK
jgi:hypothetical protein